MKACMTVKPFVEVAELTLTGEPDLSCSHLALSGKGLAVWGRA